MRTQIISHHQKQNQKALWNFRSSLIHKFPWAEKRKHEQSLCWITSGNMNYRGNIIEQHFWQKKHRFDCFLLLWESWDTKMNYFLRLYVYLKYTETTSNHEHKVTFFNCNYTVQCEIIFDLTALKGQFTPKWLPLILFQICMFFFSLWNMKEDILKNTMNQTISEPIDFHCVDIVLKISFVVFHRKKRAITFWNNTRMSK